MQEIFSNFELDFSAQTDSTGLRSKGMVSDVHGKNINIIHQETEYHLFVYNYQ